jgi:hypothetical protein
MNLGDHALCSGVHAPEGACVLSTALTATPRTRRPSTGAPPPIAEPGLPAIKLDPRFLAVATGNIRMMHLLERIARRFNDADLPLMVLKGAALNLLLYREPHERPMSDLDLMVPAKLVSRAQEILEKCGCRPGAPLVRDDFFPRYYYETEYSIGEIFPTRIDLHVRPFRPLRYARLMPPAAFWEGAQTIAVGQATVLVPDDADMLIHLAVHAAVHGCSRGKWLDDVRRWLAERGEQLDWERFLHHVGRWRLALPVRNTLNLMRNEVAIPEHVNACLAQMGVNWRDRLVLRHAPRDAEHTAAHVLVNAVCTPGLGFVLGYLIAITFPGRRHMASWYPHRHWGWLGCAHLSRVFRPPLAGLRQTCRRIFRRRAAAAGEQRITLLTDRNACWQGH